MGEHPRRSGAGWRHRLTAAASKTLTHTGGRRALAAGGSRRRRRFRMRPDTHVDRIGHCSHEPGGRAGDETPERAETLAYISRWPARAEDVGWIKLILL